MRIKKTENTPVTQQTIRRALRAKPYRVKDPGGKVHLAYALTSAGAIRAVQNALSEQWSAELASGEDLYIAARDNQPIINAPASIANAAQQPDLIDPEA